MYTKPSRSSARHQDEQAQHCREADRHRLREKDGGDVFGRPMRYADQYKWTVCLSSLTMARSVQRCLLGEQIRCARQYRLPPGLRFDHRIDPQMATPSSKLVAK